MTKSKEHEFIIKVRFDKPCGKRMAKMYIEDQLHNHSEYPYELGNYFCDDNDPSIMNVKKISQIKVSKND